MPGGQGQSVRQDRLGYLGHLGCRGDVRYLDGMREGQYAVAFGVALFGVAENSSCQGVV